MLAAAARRAARALLLPASTSFTRDARARAYGVLSDPNTFELLQGPEGRLVVDTYDARGFVIAGSYCEGALFAYEKMHAAWSPRTTADVTASSLAALEILDPTPDLVIIGTGRTVRALSEETLRYLRELGVSAEVSDTANATSTFNVLVEEGRSVAAALLPAGA